MGSRYLIFAAAAFALHPSVAAAQDNVDQQLAELAGESTQSTAAAIAEARQQTADGDMLGAVATLERALLNDPNAHDARLLYATTLCRLDDRQAAAIELAKLEGHEVSDESWRAADQACGGAFRRPAPSLDAASRTFGGEVYAGLAYDRDALGSIALQTDYGFNPIRRRHGWAAIAGVRLGMRSSHYGTSGGLYGSMSATAKHDVSGPEQDYDLGELRAGYGRAGDGNGYSVGAVLRHARVFNSPYVTEYGGQGELLFGHAQTRRARLRLEAVRQDYGDHGPTDAADGWRLDASAGLEGRVGDKGFYAVGVGGERKTADMKILGYHAARLFGLVQLPVGTRGHYVNASGTFRYVDFRDDPPEPDRKDKRVFVRAAYGLPLVSKLFGEAAISYTRRSSDFDSTTEFPNYFDLSTYRSLGADARLIWRF